MIRAFRTKELVGFDGVELEFKSGLTVFTGASGSGKSVLMEGILSVFGYKEPKATSAEAVVEAPFCMLEEFGIENEEQNIFRYLKKDKTRYFINAQAISKKDITTTAKEFSAYLSSKDDNDFKSEKILAALDSFVDDTKFADAKKEYVEAFGAFNEIAKELKRLRDKSLKAAEEREFLEFELQKFEQIAPQENEEEELTALKKELAKKEKISASLAKANVILAHKQAAAEIFEFLGKDADVLEGFFAELEDALGEVDYKLSRLGSVDIDFVFERLEKLSYLNKRYGGIKEALEYFEDKKAELKELSKLDDLISSLELDEKNALKKLKETSAQLSEYRKKALPKFEERLSFYAKKLLITAPNVELKECEYGLSGADNADFKIKGSDVGTQSAGEYRRLRLAMMACESGTAEETKVLFLDEADANLSGEESAGVAYLLKELSSAYQIFAVSHQPQLASVAKNHFLVSKQDGKSLIKELSKDERVTEIARMVSSGDIKPEALEYAKRMLKEGE